jgi:excisionase family DNA binding protein
MKTITEKKAVPEKEVYSVAELAAKLGVSDDCLYIMVRRKQIPHIRLLSRILFRKEVIDEWMVEQETKNYRQ